MLEGVQRRATKIILSLRNLSCEEILKRLSMFFLRRRRLMGDMIEVLKMIYGIDNVNLGNLFFFISEHPWSHFRLLVWVFIKVL